jgi:hypothetical protein
MHNPEGPAARTHLLPLDVVVPHCFLSILDFSISLDPLVKLREMALTPQLSE